MQKGGTRAQAAVDGPTWLANCRHHRGGSKAGKKETARQTMASKKMLREIDDGGKGMNRKGVVYWTGDETGLVRRVATREWWATLANN